MLVSNASPSTPTAAGTPSLQLRTDGPKGTVHIEGAASVPAQGVEQVMGLLRQGAARRTVGETSANERSSRWDTTRLNSAPSNTQLITASWHAKLSRAIACGKQALTTPVRPGQVAQHLFAAAVGRRAFRDRQTVQGERAQHPALPGATSRPGPMRESLRNRSSRCVPSTETMRIPCTKRPRN